MRESEIWRVRDSQRGMGTKDKEGESERERYIYIYRERPREEKREEKMLSGKCHLKRCNALHHKDLPMVILPNSHLLRSSDFCGADLNET